MQLPLPPVERVISFLLQEGMLLETGSDVPGLVPARPLDRIPVEEWLRIVRQGAEGHAQLTLRPGAEVIVDNDKLGPLIDRLDEARRDALDGLTLRDLVTGTHEATPVTDKVASISKS